MGWLDFLKRDKESPLKETDALNIADYPKAQYKVYWEVHKYDNVPDGPWGAEVRFIGWASEPHVSIHTITTQTEPTLDELIKKLVREKMEGYKR